jgi:hypothetical protein
MMRILSKGFDVMPKLHALGTIDTYDASSFEMESEMESR